MKCKYSNSLWEPIRKAQSYTFSVFQKGNNSLLETAVMETNHKNVSLEYLIFFLLVLKWRVMRRTNYKCFQSNYKWVCTHLLTIQKVVQLVHISSFRHIIPRTICVSSLSHKALLTRTPNISPCFYSSKHSFLILWDR